jgi:hypothetical protein
VVKLLTLLQHQFVFSFLFGLPSDQALSLDRELERSELAQGVVHFYIYNEKHAWDKTRSGRKGSKSKKLVHVCSVLCYAGVGQGPNRACSAGAGPAGRMKRGRACLHLYICTQHAKRPHPHMITVLFMIITVELLSELTCVGSGNMVN